MIQARVIVRGRVQGVWFRQSTLETARSLGLAGWVRNLPTGEVEALFEGDSATVEKAVAWCHDGPPAARVTGVERENHSPEGLAPPFLIRQTP